MDAQLPALQIVIPLLAAPICVLLRNRTIAYIWSLAISWAVFANAVALLLRVLDEGIISYEMGGWAAPWGIEYRLDLLGAFMLLFVSAIGALVLTYAPSSLAREIPRDRQYLFLTAYLLCLTGLLGIVNVASGLKPNGMVIVNTKKSAKQIGKEFGISASIATVDATRIAREQLGVPITNTTMVGAVVRATGVVNLESLVVPLKDRFGRLAERNINAMKRAYEETTVKEQGS